MVRSILSQSDTMTYASGKTCAALIQDQNLAPQAEPNTKASNRVSRRQFARMGLAAGLGFVSTAGLAGPDFLFRSVAQAQSRRFYAKRFRGKRAPKLRVGNWVKNQVPLKGKPMLIKFFATWCGVCRRSVGPLDKLQREFEGKLRVIAIADEPVSVIEGFTNRNIKFSLCRDKKGRTFKKYGIEGVFPHFVFVSRKGYVRMEGPLPVDDYKKLRKRVKRYL